MRNKIELSWVKRPQSSDILDLIKQPHKAAFLLGLFNDLVNGYCKLLRQTPATGFFNKPEFFKLQEYLHFIGNQTLIALVISLITFGYFLVDIFSTLETIG